MSRSLLDRYAGDPVLVRLGRLRADCAVWRRRLASCLVGLVPASEAVAAAVRVDPALPAPVRTALAEAGNRAETMLGHIRAGAWGEAAQAFTAFEACLGETVTAAEAASDALAA